MFPFLYRISLNPHVSLKHAQEEMYLRVPKEGKKKVARGNASLGIRLAFPFL